MHRVFHGIRFKVKKEGRRDDALFSFLYDTVRPQLLQNIADTESRPGRKASRWATPVRDDLFATAKALHKTKAEIAKIDFLTFIFEKKGGKSSYIQKETVSLQPQKSQGVLPRGHIHY